MTAKISHYSGSSSIIKECKYCKLNTPAHYMKNDEHCIMCYQFSEFTRLIASLSRFSLISLLTGVFLFFVESLRTFGIVLFIIGIIPSILSMSMENKLVYRKIPIIDRVNHMLKFYEIQKKSNNYTNALKIMMSLETPPSLDHKNMIMSTLVDSVILSKSFNPPKFFEVWPEVLGISEQEFVDYLLNNTDILNGLGAEAGTGLLPDLWPYLENDEVKDQILIGLASVCEELEDFSDLQQKYFLEDLYLIEDELKEYIGNDKDYQIIIEKIDNFVPEMPPKNMFEEQKMKQAAMREDLDRTRTVTHEKEGSSHYHDGPVCDNCETTNEPEALFCVKCGNSLTK